MRDKPQEEKPPIAVTTDNARRISYLLRAAEGLVKGEYGDALRETLEQLSDAFETQQRFEVEVS